MHDPINDNVVIILNLEQNAVRTHSQTIFRTKVG